MIICSITGFLGSGKTTLVIELSKRLARDHKKVAIIVNEVGEVGVDGSLMEAYGLQTKEITEGCICCALSHTLMNTLQALSKGYQPDVVFIEPTGVALPSKIEKVIRTSLVEYEGKCSICLVDAFRAERISKEAASFFTLQVKGANLIAISKIELVTQPELERVIGLVESVNPTARIVTISTKMNVGIEELKESVLFPGKEIQ
jgi:G3E family GTPase